MNGHHPPAIDRHTRRRPDTHHLRLLGPLREEIVTHLSLRLSDVLATEAARREEQVSSHTRRALILDRDLQRSMAGGWIQEEIATIGQRRLAKGERPLDVDEVNELRHQVLAQMFGHGPLEQWMQDDTVEEIDVNSHASTWVTFTDGRKENVGQLWDSPETLTAYQKGLVLRMGTAGESRLDTSSPMVTLQADDGSRVVMVLGGASEHGVSTHPRIAIRRFTVRQVGLGGLADRGLFPHWIIPQLTALVRTGFTMLVSGGPGAGKTTLLTELLGVVSPLERIVTVEKSLLELRLEDDPRHPDAPALFTRQANAEQRGEVTTRSLVELTRRLNPDRVVVGELVEDEAYENDCTPRWRPRGRTSSTIRSFYNPSGRFGPGCPVPSQLAICWNLCRGAPSAPLSEDASGTRPEIWRIGMHPNPSHSGHVKGAARPVPRPLPTFRLPLQVAQTECPSIVTRRSSRSTIRRRS